MRLLSKNKDWQQTEQAGFFAATLFQNTNFCERLGITAHQWTEYQRLRQQLISIEQLLAESYFSKEQMETFRKHLITDSWTDKALEYPVIRHIQALELALLQGEKPCLQTARDIVNVIRNNPKSFPDWAASPTAQLFAPEIFSNKKASGGYWF